MESMISNIILLKAYNRPKELRFGQAVYEYANSFFPDEVNKLTEKDIDCFEKDENVVLFLTKLEEELKKFK